MLLLQRPESKSLNATKIRPPLHINLFSQKNQNLLLPSQFLQLIQWNTEVFPMSWVCPWGLLLVGHA